MVKQIFLALLLIPILGGCCACRKGSPVIGNLESKRWTLVELNENGASSQIYLNFDASSKVLSGTSDCHKIYAGYHLFEREAGNIEFLQPGHAGEGCPENPEIVTLTNLLPSVKTVKIDGGHLLFIDQSQNIVAVFE